jgi:hypothetical protein
VRKQEVGQVMNREQLARRSWALAEMYPTNILPPYEEQVAFAEKHAEAMDLIRNMQAGGVSYNVARRTVVGLPPYPPANTEGWVTPTSPPAEVVDKRGRMRYT